MLRHAYVVKVEKYGKINGLYYLSLGRREFNGTKKNERCFKGIKRCFLILKKKVKKRHGRKNM